jgi:hypothetical protein
MERQLACRESSAEIAPLRCNSLMGIKSVMVHLIATISCFVSPLVLGWILAKAIPVVAEGAL